MTRKEEIQQAAIKELPHFVGRRVGCIGGTEWADKAMIDKVCEWLKELSKTATIQEYSTGITTSKEALVNRFRKAMVG